mmetsp:Transcript_54047/g.65019  ORF Transcript_54047/g.65019 Transcript_54047/m.65019 type:complete len:365 (+) Transcript_54047:104-1198(+)
MTTSQATASYLPSSLSTISPSLKLAPSTALNQMPCPTTVRNLPLPRDTPGPSPDETSQRKSYAAALLTEAARPKSGPLGLNNAAWPPLASMADPPPKQFVLAKDRVPPDRPKPKNKRRRRPRTRRHRKPPRDNQHTTDSPLKSETNLIAVLSSLVSDIQTQSLVELNEIFATRIKNLKNEIITNLKNALRFAIKKLRAKLRAEITFMQEQHEQKHSKSSKQQTKKWPILHPPRTHKSDYVLKTCTSTDDDESIFSDQDGAQKNFEDSSQESEPSSGSLVATRRDLASDGVDERCIHEGPLVATRQFDGVDERPVRELATNNFFDCHLVEVGNAPVEQYSDGEQDDGGTSDGGWSASGASAQADY